MKEENIVSDCRVPFEDFIAIYKMQLSQEEKKNNNPKITIDAIVTDTENLSTRIYPDT